MGTPKSDEKWAAKLRRNLIAHGALPPAPYFLLVLPDHVYLWSHPERGESALPDFQGETRLILNGYLGHWSGPGNREAVSERGLELAVSTWLMDLTNPTQSSAPDGGEGTEWLHRSGLPRMLRSRVVEDHASCVSIVAVGVAGSITS